MEYNDAKKFIAIFDGDMGDGTSSFYIVDEEFYKAEDGGVNEDEDYSPEVYACIEQLGRGCLLAAENFFTVKGVMKSEDDLRKFLKPLKWIVVESDYLKGAKIEEFKDKPKDFIQEIKKLNSSDVVYINDLGDAYFTDIFNKFTNSGESFDKNDFKKGISWIKKELSEGKFVAFSSDYFGDSYYLYTFKNKDEYLEKIKKTQEIKNRLIPNKKLPENANRAAKLASELKVPYILSNSKEELDEWEKLANQCRMEVIRGENLILAFNYASDSRDFAEKLSKFKKGNSAEILKKNAKKLDIPFCECNNREDFHKILMQLEGRSKTKKSLFQTRGLLFILKSEDERKKLIDYSFLDEDSFEPENEDENY